MHTAIAYFNSVELIPEPKSVPVDQTTASFDYRDFYSFAVASSIFQPILKTGTSLSGTIERTTQIEKILLDNFPEVKQCHRDKHFSLNTA